VAKLNLRLPNTHSLKDKRRVIKSLITKTRQDHYVAISEVEAHDDIRQAVVGIALISNNAQLNESILQKLLNSIERNPEVELENEEIDQFNL